MLKEKQEPSQIQQSWVKCQYPQKQIQRASYSQFK
jgi:hypothetical protein